MPSIPYVSAIPMPKQKPTDKVQALEKQRSDLEAKLTAARKEAKDRAKAEARRRHEIAGAAVVHELDANPDSSAAKALLRLLDANLKRPGERALFGLGAGKPAPETKAAAE